MGTIASAALALAMLAVFLLAAGGVKLILDGQQRKQGLLMLIAAAVLLGNVLVWTL